MIWTHESGPVGAPLIVLVHGSMDRSASMVKLSRLLDPDCHVVRYDRRGYGRSKPHPGPFLMDGQVADLIEVLAGRRAAVVFGHSFGGNVALATAARHAELVGTVCVYETPLSWFEWWPGTTRRWNTDGVDPGDVAERFMRRMVGDAGWERLPERVREERRSEGTALGDEIGDIAAHAPWAPEQITMPVLAMHGSESSAHHQAGAQHLAGLLSDRPAVEVAGANHNGQYSHPDAVAAAIRTLI